jgi:hypothetical protein
MNLNSGTGGNMMINSTVPQSKKVLFIRLPARPNDVRPGTP